MLARNDGRVPGVMAASPMIREKMKATEVRLTAMPRVRMAPIMPEATPNWRRSTLPMMAVELGVMKTPKPRPMSPSSAPSSQSEVSGPMVRAASSRPAELVSMPAVASRAGSMRSASRPARGEDTTCTTGWMSRTNPACRGESPLANCR